jgi:group II intron reverse transcriptase/maturase
MPFVFADSPTGSGHSPRSGVPDGRAYLLLTAKALEATGSAAPAADTTRLLEAAVSPPNLAEALLRVARNRGAPGVDGKSVTEVVAGARRLLPKLRSAVLSGDYVPGDVRRVWIPKPGGGQRGLGIPNVVDRWVQQAVHQALSPLLEPDFHDSSHGFRPGRGAKTALVEAKGYLRDGHTWLVSIDLSKFFDRVNHQRLLARLAQRVGDVRLLRLVGRMLKASVVMPDGTRVSSEEGTPQGGPLSPLLSNLVLDELDQELERRGLRFVRYADDFIVFVRSLRAGQRVMASLTRFIERRMRLLVNESKSAVARPEEVHFLGFTLRLNEQCEVEVHLSERSHRRLDRKLRELTPRQLGRSLESCFAAVNRYLRGWLSHFQLCSEEGARLFQRHESHVRRRIRAIIVRQRKRPRFLYRHLRARGVSHRMAMQTAYVGRGPWYQSNRYGMWRAYPNAWFHERMVSLLSEWKRRNPVATVSGQAFLPGFEQST